MNDNLVDTEDKKGYNQDNDEHVVVRMAGRPPINNPTCEHEFVEDPTDVIGNKVAWMCIKPNCGIGHWREIHKNPS